MKHQEITQLIAAKKSDLERKVSQWELWERLYRNHSGDVREFPTGSRPSNADNTQLNAGTVIPIASNYPYGYIDTVAATIVPATPKIEAIPRSSADTVLAANQSLVVNSVFRTEKINKTIRAAAIRAIIHGIGFIKSVYNKEKASVRHYYRSAKSVWFDTEAARWDEITYLGEITYVKQSVVEGRIKNKLYKVKPDVIPYGAKPTWARTNGTSGREEDRSNANAVFRWATIIEFYDFVDKKFYHLLENGTILFCGPLPYPEVINNYTPIVFNDNLEDLSGLSDIKLIYDLHVVLDEIDRLELHHAATSIPITLVDKRVTSAAEEALGAVARLNIPGGYLPVGVNPNYSLKDMFSQTPVTQLPIGFDKMRARVLAAIEFILGLPQYARGVLGGTTIATEAALADTALRTRMGMRIQVINETLERLAYVTMQLFHQYKGDNNPIKVEPTRTQNAQAFDAQQLWSDEKAFYVKFEAIEHSPLSNNKQFRLQQLTQAMPLLQASPNVDQGKLTLEFLTLLEIEHVYKEAPPPPVIDPNMPTSDPASPPPPGLRPGGPSLPGVDASGLTDVEAGDLPPGTGLPLPAAGNGFGPGVG